MAKKVQTRKYAKWRSGLVRACLSGIVYYRSMNEIQATEESTKTLFGLLQQRLGSGLDEVTQARFTPIIMISSDFCVLHKRTRVHGASCTLSIVLLALASSWQGSGLRHPRIEVSKVAIFHEGS